jgi:spoIIIJ-associated protein
MEKSLMNEQVKEFFVETFKYLKIKPSLEVTSDDEGTCKVTIEGNDLNFLIGYRGESLEALQILASQILFRKTNEWNRISVDINGYKDQKMDKIEEITKSFIDRVRFHGHPVEMPPMSPSERRHVHVFLTQYDDVVSESTGEGRYRHIVLSPKQN